MTSKIIVISIFLLASSILNAQKITQAGYVEKFKNIAILEQRRSGVPAAITLAQGVLESESGNSYLAKEGRNHFGIKCKLEWTGGKVYRDDDERNECFRQYNTDLESYKDHSDFLKLRPYYKECFTIDVNDYKAWAKCLKKCGYATERNYPDMLIGLIEKLKLQQYTEAALNENYIVENANTEEANKEALTNKNISNTTINNTKIVDQGSSEHTTIAPIKIEEIRVAPKSVGTYGNTIKINGVKAIMVYQETPLLTIAQKYDIPLARIKEWNDLNDQNVVPYNQPMFLRSKKDGNKQKNYTVKSNETIYFISQKLGIQMFKLLEYNNLTMDAPLTAGTILKLEDSNKRKTFKEKINRLLGK